MPQHHTLNAGILQMLTLHNLHTIVEAIKTALRYNAGYFSHVRSV